MRLIDADALLKKTINNPLHVPYITKKDVIDMPSALNNQVNLCDSCTYTYPECSSEKDDVIFGNGIGNDNICACNKYQPTVQPVATDTNVGDTISRQAAIDALDCINEVEEVLRSLPTMQPERAEGEWSDGYRWQRCSLCKQTGKKSWNYCPNCGAKMKGERQK